ncbi:hypothetical protein [Streptomyces naphthomycinicus]|uniref:hypothetical protein n=1 Tax=Streptomyces naphthomycinicus TaxID=2872625 RepID=UPI001CED2CB1|nr:hypothetical protein [Streptomyces sp. TML10]
MIRLDTALAGLGGALGGGLFGAAAHYLVKALGQRHRDEESGLLAQRQAVHQQFERVCAARDWMAGLPGPAGVPGAPECRQRIQDEAVRRSVECHASWTAARKDVDSDEVRSAMAGLDREITAVLGRVAQGDLAPDLAPLRQRLDGVTAAARHRLTTRLPPRSSPVTRLLGSGEGGGRHASR